VKFECILRLLEPLFVRYGTIECFAVMTMAFFLIGYGIGAIIFLIMWNKSA